MTIVPCRHKRDALRVLMGELGPAQSSRMLEHCRVCGECREAFDFAAATITRTSGQPAAARAPAAEAGVEAQAVVAVPDEGPAPSHELRRFPNPARRNRRILVVFAVAILAVALSGIGRPRDGQAPGADVSDEVMWRRLVRDGTPVVQAPAGTFEGRPRVIVALVPPGSGPCHVTVVDATGRAVFQSSEKPGERGCFLEEADIPAPGGGFRAGRLLVPFPDEAALALDAGRPYGVIVAVSGGHASASSVFQVSNPGAGLHPARPEER